MEGISKCRHDSIRTNLTWLVWLEVALQWCKHAESWIRMRVLGVFFSNNKPFNSMGSILKRTEYATTCERSKERVFFFYIEESPFFWPSRRVIYRLFPNSSQAAMGCPPQPPWWRHRACSLVGAGAGLGWLVLIFCEKKTLLAGWFGLAETNKRTGWFCSPILLSFF